METTHIIEGHFFLARSRYEYPMLSFTHRSAVKRTNGQRGNKNQQNKKIKIKAMVTTTMMKTTATTTTTTSTAMMTTTQLLNYKSTYTFVCSLFVRVVGTNIEETIKSKKISHHGRARERVSVTFNFGTGILIKMFNICFAHHLDCKQYGMRTATVTVQPNRQVSLHIFWFSIHVLNSLCDCIISSILLLVGIVVVRSSAN